MIPNEGKPLLQGWAIVDNTVGEDWRDVELSLVAGAPQSFIQELSQPYPTRRPVVELPENAMLTPQTYEATMEQQSDILNGELRSPKKVATGVVSGVPGGVPGGSMGGSLEESPAVAASPPQSFARMALHHQPLPGPMPR